MGSAELHVLAVDDNHVDRRLMSVCSKSRVAECFAVSGVRRGDHSSLGLYGLEVNLIMTDYSMTGMTGYELLKKIKESSTMKEVPVVIMSSANILTRIDRGRRIPNETGEAFRCRTPKSFILRAQGEKYGESKSRKRKLQDSLACGQSNPEQGPLKFPEHWCIEPKLKIWY